MDKKIYSYVDYYLGILSIIFFIVYVTLISMDTYINKNSPEWVTASIENKKYVGYTNMIGNLFMILVCGFDSVVYMNSSKVYISRYIIKLVILLLFIGLSYDVVPDNTIYGKFNSALQPLVSYLQVLSISTIVQIVRKLDLKLHSSKSTNDNTSDNTSDNATTNTSDNDSDSDKPSINSLESLFEENE
jgi:hypothetical protein